MGGANRQVFPELFPNVTKGSVANEATAKTKTAKNEKCEYLNPPMTFFFISGVNDLGYKHVGGSIRTPNTGLMQGWTNGD